MRSQNQGEGTLIREIHNNNTHINHTLTEKIMSKKNFLPFLVMAAILMALASCSGKLKPLSAQYIQADPQPLEVVGEQPTPSKAKRCAPTTK